MIKKISDQLLALNLINQQEKKDLQKKFNDIKQFDVVKFITQKYAENQRRQIVERMWASSQLKNILHPSLYKQFLKYQLFEGFGIDITDPDQKLCVEDQVQNNYQNHGELIKNIYIGLMGETNEQQIQEMTQSFADLKKQADQIKISLSQSKEQDDLKLSQKFALDSKRKNCLEYLHYLNQDIQQIPQTVIQYQFAKAEIQLCEKFLKDNEDKYNNQMKYTCKLIQKISSFNDLDGQCKKALEQIRNQNDVGRNIKVLRHRIVGLDVKQLFRMLKKGRQLEQQKKKTKKINKKIRVIMFIGLSKAGKTTIMTRLMGYEMKKMKINGIFTIQPINPEQMSEEHKQLVIGYQMKSTTRYPKWYQIKIQKQNEDDDDDDDQFITYGMDCAGFQDSSGTQVQISNRITAIECLSKVDQLQIAIVINQKSFGDKGQKIAALAETVSSIIKDYKKVKKCITFVFNQFDQNSRDTFYSKIVSLYNSMHQISKKVLDQNHKQFFKHLKESCKTPKKMFCVDPINLVKQDFIKQVSKQKEKITDPMSNLVSDIGMKPKEDVNKYCERCKKQFNICYQKKDMAGAQYYLRMLQLIAKEDKLQSSADRQIQNMKSAIQKDLSIKISALQIQFQQLQTSYIRDPVVRQNKIKTINDKYNQLKKESQCIQKLNKNSQLTKKMESIIKDNTKWYLVEIENWKNQDILSISDLSNTTTNAISFFKIFKSSDSTLQVQLKGFLSVFKKNILTQFFSLIQKHQIKKHYQKFLTLSKILGQSDQDLLKTQIKSKFLNLRQNMALINLQKLRNQNLQGDLIKPTLSQENDIKGVQDLLKFCNIILTYPKQTIIGNEEQISYVLNDIVVNVPQAVLKEFQKLSRIDKKEEQQEKEEDQMTEMQSNERDQNIKKIQTIIKWLRILDKIPQIKSYHGNKLLEKIQRIQDIIQKQMRNIQKIKNNFSLNDTLMLKKDINKIISEVKKLINLVKVADSKQLNTKFQDLKDGLKDSIISFVQQNDYSQFLTINVSSDKQIKNLFTKNEKLFEIKSVSKVLGNEIKQRAQAIISSNSKKLIGPLQTFYKQMQQKNDLLSSKLIKCIKYIQSIKLNENNKLFQAISLQLIEIQTKLRNRIIEIYKQTVSQPVQKLCDMLLKQIYLDQENLIRIELFLKDKQNLKARNAQNFLYQKSPIYQIYFSDGDDLKDQLKRNLDQFKVKIEDKISIKNIDFNTLQKVLSITQQLKSILFQKTIFDDIQKQIRAKMKNFTDKKQQIIDNFKKSYQDSKIFDQQNFKDLYHKYSTPKNQSENIYKQQLESTFTSYKNSVRKQMQRLDTELLDEETVISKISQTLKIFENYHKNVYQIREKIGENQQFTKISNLKNSQKIIHHALQALKQYSEKIESKVFETENTEIKKVVKKLSQIESSILSIKKYIPTINFDIIQQYKKNRNCKYLHEIFSNKLVNKESKINQLSKGQNIQNHLDGKFSQFFSSLNQKERAPILKQLDAYIEKKILQLKRLRGQDFQKYVSQKKCFQSYVGFMPQSRSDTTLHKINILDQCFKNQQNQSCKQLFETEQVSIKSIINLSFKNINSKNKEANDNLVISLKQYSKKQLFLNQNYLNFLQKQLWENKPQLIKLPQILNQLQRPEFKLCTKMKKQFEVAWQRIKSEYSRQDSSQDGSQLDILLSLSRIQPNKKKNIQCVVTIYDCLKANQGNLLFEANKQICQKIINSFENQLIIFVELATQNINSFKNIIKDPKSCKNISETIKNINILEQDIQVFFNTKSQHFRACSQYLKMKQANRNISKLKTDMQNQIKFKNCFKFSFYDDQIRTMTTQLLQKTIQKYQSHLDYLQYLQNDVNENQLIKSKINFEQAKKNIKIQIQKAKQEYEIALKQVFDRPQAENMNEKINIIHKVFNQIKSKPRIHFTQFEQHCNKLKQLTYGFLKPQIQQFQIKVKEIIQKVQTENSNIQKFKTDQKQKNKKIIQEKRSETDQKISDVKKKYLNLIQSNQKQKGKFQKQMKAQVQSLENIFNKESQLISDKYNQKLSDLIKKSKKNDEEKIQQICNKLIFLTRLCQISSLSFQIQKFLNQQMKKIKNYPNIIKSIYNFMKESNNFYAATIIQQFPAFKKYKALQRQQDTQKTNSAQYILGEMYKKGHITSNQKSYLQERYELFEEQQKKYINRYKQVSDKQDRKQIVHQIMLKISTDGQDFKNSLEENSQVNFQEKKRVIILARIFALWSITSSDTEQSDQQVIICFKAHAAQVICILLTLCLDNVKQKQVVSFNRLAEVKTGQGKSIILAILSIYFAICGYEVHCACYSPILSKRDQKDFERLFQLCKVKQKISYGVFEQIIKKVLNQSDKDANKSQKFQNVIKQILTKQPEQSGIVKFIKKYTFFGKIVNFFSNAGKSGNKIKKVLIIDEIDVLFNQNYFGDTFNQSIELRDPSIVDLFKFIWANKQKINPQIISNSNQFKMVINRFKTLKNVLENQINGMVLALQTYQNQNYVIQDKKIMYKVEDVLVDVSYRYNTVYAYLDEYYKNKVCQSAFIQHMTIDLCVAEFSYACLPEYYDYLVGVTGTLTCLPQYIKTYLEQRYKIGRNQMFPIPSVYGSSTENRKILQPQCSSKEKFKAQITTKIKVQFNNNRPILVFFRNKLDLIDLFTSDQYKQLQPYTTCITQEHDEIERQARIKNCSFKSTITFLTNVFIRGVDFKLQNKAAIQNGGFYGIVAYLINNEAEWIQATGRVARQGKPGSICQFYSDDQFQIFAISKDVQQKFQKVSSERKLTLQKQKDSAQIRLKQSQIKHNQTIEVFSAQKFSQTNLVEYVLKKNKFPIIKKAKKVRICLVMDKTISMSQCDYQLKRCLPQIFDDINQTLQKANIKGCLQMQIVFYRNYNSPLNELLSFSPFQVQSLGLKDFVSKSSVSGGWGNQAVQVALQHVNKQKDVQQIIIFADAAGNMPRQISAKRNHPNYIKYQEQRLRAELLPTDTETQVKQLINKNIKVHSLYLSKLNTVQSYFNHLSNATHGQSRYLDLYDKDSANTITQFIVGRALKLIGGSSDGDALISHYKAILNKRMAR